MITEQDEVRIIYTSRRNLASGLVAGGTVRSRWLRRAFEETPREMFVPRFYRSESGREVLLDGTDPQQQEWLRGVYTDAALTGQLTPVPDLAHGAAAPTSSRSMSTVMPGMLEALDLQPGHRVLEIGTGTGYNTALLCHRVGADNVTSVELDSRLADTALQALTAVGLTPAVHTGDGLRCFFAYPADPKIEGDHAGFFGDHGCSEGRGHRPGWAGVMTWSVPGGVVGDWGVG